MSFHKSISARVSETGRLSLPVEVRREVGLEKGGSVRIDLRDGVIRIRTISEIRDNIRTLARKTGFADRASVADFLAHRTRERKREGGTRE